MLFSAEEASVGPCIYEIVNTYSGRRYVGQSTAVYRRWHRGHEQPLLRNKHHNRFLQHDFNKCVGLLGHTDFLEFHILETLVDSSPQHLSERESFWIAERKACGEIYNHILVGQSPSLDENTRKKISETKRAFYQTDAGQAIINSLAAAKSGKTYEELFGQERSVLIREAISQNKLIEMNKPEVKERLRRLLLGKTEVERYGPEKAAIIKEKKSLARKGRFTGVDSSRYRVIEGIQLVSPAGVVYTRIDGIKEFALTHGLSKSHLCELLAGKRKTHKGWHLTNAE